MSADTVPPSESKSQQLRNGYHRLGWSGDNLNQQHHVLSQGVTHRGLSDAKFHIVDEAMNLPTSARIFNPHTAQADLVRILEVSALRR